MARPFEYVNSGKTLGTVFLTVVGVLLIAGGIMMEAPWYIYIPLAIFTALGLVPFLSKATWRLTLDQTTLAWGKNDETTEVPVSEIDRVVFDAWSEETDVRVVRRDGGAEIIPEACVPVRADAFKSALRVRGVTIEER